MTRFDGPDTQEEAMSSEPRLTAAAKRHLSDMVGPDGESLFWRVRGAGEHRVARKLHIAGLLLPMSHGMTAYILSPSGLEVARRLSEGAQHDPE